MQRKFFEKPDSKLTATEIQSVQIFRESSSELKNMRETAQQGFGLTEEMKSMLQKIDQADTFSQLLISCEGFDLKKSDDRWAKEFAKTGLPRYFFFGGTVGPDLYFAHCALHFREKALEQARVCEFSVKPGIAGN